MALPARPPTTCLPSIGGLLFVLAAAAPIAGQQPAIDPGALRARLEIIAHDSMGGRDTGSYGSYLASTYVASEFRRAGLRPGGESGTYFQGIPFFHVRLDPANAFSTIDGPLHAGRDFVPVGPAIDWVSNGTKAVYGGVAGDSLSWPPAEQVAGRIVVFRVPDDADLRSGFALIGPTITHRRFERTMAAAFIMLDGISAETRDQLLQGSFVTDQTVPPGLPVLLVTRAAGASLLSADVSMLSAGATGSAVRGRMHYLRDRPDWTARNVIAILPGSDPELRNTFVAVSAHSDHTGLAFSAVDHDSTLAHNRVVRPLGADSEDREPTVAELMRIRAIRDSLDVLRLARRDSIYNGADDDGSGTVALVEIARLLAEGPPLRRSVLFVSHTAEERGLLGSRWFTDHPTVSLDSIVSEIDMDMIGRGGEQDLPNGGPAYLEVIGASRLSREYGDLFEQVNARQATPFTLNYEFDQPGHPLQYYCRADHYSYARHGIPSMAVSRGEHSDYHQVTDEPQYIDYNGLARVATLVRDFIRTIADLDHRPSVDGPRPDPGAPCVQ